jgi:radical SAM superfamily enzyme YgiQ (UPF0313 family)
MQITHVLPRSQGWMGRVHKSGRAGIPRLSLCLLAALTPPGHRQRLVDTRFGDPNFDDDTDLVALTAFTGEATHAYHLADEYRRHGKRVVMGGIHASMLPEEASQHVDAVVIGEAETVWPRVVNHAETGRLERIYRADDLVNLAGLPLPRRDLLDSSHYFTISSLQATRGCPYDCSFCSVTAFLGRKVRTRMVSEIVAEVRQLPNRRSIMFLDDNIAIRRTFAKELFAALQPLDIRWNSQASINCAEDTELMRLMCNSGCDFVLVGFESVDQASLDGANKGRWSKVAEYAGAIRVFHGHGINVLGSFVVGLDHDDRSVFPRTLAFIQDTGLDGAVINICTPYPGTALRAELENQGRIFDTDWSHYSNSAVTYYPRLMSPHELLDGYYWLQGKLYEPAAMARRVFKWKRNIASRIAFNVSSQRKARRLPSVKLDEIGRGPSHRELPPHVQNKPWADMLSLSACPKDLGTADSRSILVP